MLISFKMFILIKGSLLSQSLRCTRQPVLKWLILQGVRGEVMGGVDVDEIAAPVLTLLLILN